MGAYVSIRDCAANYNVTLNCTAPTSANGLFTTMGGVARGQFQPDPDIAGIGVLVAFIAVTALSLVLSIISNIWWLSKHVFRIKRRISEDQKSQKRYQVSVSHLLEILVVTCSDQQVFTGAAYAITMRYSKGCSISAYHYNIVGNMLLLTCATHLMAVTIASRYWEHPYVAVLRIIITAAVYLATGILLSNQGGSTSLAFPTQVPPLNTSNSLMFLSAACFQSDAQHLGSTLAQSFSSASAAENAFFNSQVGNQIHGWNNYLFMLVFYVLSIPVSAGRFVRRGVDKGGRRTGWGERLRRSCAPVVRWKRLFYAIFGLYLIGGVGISTWTVVTSALYIASLRVWVNQSGWLQLQNGFNPEDDPTTFGQLVPMLLVALTIFTFLQILSERLSINRRRRSDPSSNDDYDTTLKLQDSWDSSPRNFSTPRTAPRTPKLPAIITVSALYEDLPPESRPPVTEANSRPPPSSRTRSRSNTPTYSLTPKINVQRNVSPIMGDGTLPPLPRKSSARASRPVRGSAWPEPLALGSARTGGGPEDGF